MDYRYQETFSWIIPGFYFLFCLGIEILMIFPQACISINLTSLFDTSISDSTVALLVFSIPIFSFIIGWIFNGFAGYLFRYIMKKPTTDAYDDEFGKDDNGNFKAGFDRCNDKEAEKIFNKARRKIKLEDVDRFYYRYVASRNMYFAQLILCILSFFFLVSSLISSRIIIAISWLVISLCLAYLFWLITARDLNTHARYVFIKYKELTTSE